MNRQQPKKKGFYALLIVSIVGMMAFTIFYVAMDFGPRNDSLVLIKDTYNIELGENEDIKIEDVLLRPNDDIKKNAKIALGEVTSNGEENILSLDTAKYAVGSYKAKITYNEEEVNLEFKIRDTTAPKFVDFESTIIVEQSAKEVDLEKYFEITDYSPAELTLETKKVKLDEIGTYKISVSAKDKYNNAISKDCSIKVVSFEDAKKYGVTAMRDGTTPISEMMAAYITENNLMAIGGEIVEYDEELLAQWEEYYASLNTTDTTTASIGSGSSNTTSSGNGSINKPNIGSGSSSSGNSSSGGSTSGGSSSGGSSSGGTDGGNSGTESGGNSGGSSGTDTGNNSGGGNTPDPKEELVGNSGKWFTTRALASSYASAQKLNIFGPWFGKSDRITYHQGYGYTVDFY